MANAVAWACLPPGSSSRWHAQRLGVIRLLAAHLHGSADESAELIPTGLIPHRIIRSAPYLYRPQQIGSLIAQADTLLPLLRGHTLATVIALMAATGMRTAEALALNTADIDTGDATIAVIGKGGRHRILPVHHTTITALSAYIASRDSAVTSRGDALFANPAGSRPVANTLQQDFRRVATVCDLPPALGQRQPPLHDLRHTFAVNTLLDAHRSGSSVNDRIDALATYLGHSSPIHTYWYLSASPELLQIVSDRIESQGQGNRS